MTYDSIDLTQTWHDVYVDLQAAAAEAPYGQLVVWLEGPDSEDLGVGDSLEDAPDGALFVASIPTIYGTQRRGVTLVACDAMRALLTTLGCLADWYAEEDAIEEDARFERECRAEWAVARRNRDVCDYSEGDEP